MNVGHELYERYNNDKVDQETYQRIYDILEKHTTTWVVDAWKKRPVKSAITVKALRSISREQALAVAKEHDLNPEGTLKAREFNQGMVKLFVNEQCTLIAKNLASDILTALEEHDTTTR